MQDIVAEHVNANRATNERNRRSYHVGLAFVENGRTERVFGVGRPSSKENMH